ncbi:MAG: phosphoesterase, partial [Cyanobacteria bacterium P01_D01_bin.73]
MAAFDQLFDEAFYLESYPDIAAVVQAGLIPSGLAHFLGAGIQEGRTLISRFYRDSDGEQRYLTANPDVAAVVGPGGLASGLQHFLGIGEIEGRSLFPGGFDEDWYRRRYP